MIFCLSKFDHIISCHIKLLHYPLIDFKKKLIHDFIFII